MKKETYEPKESPICQTLIEYAAWKHPGVLIIKIDNEGKTTLQEGARKKREGKKKGASDYFVAEPRKLAKGLFLEVKAYKGRESKAQQEFGQLVLSKGYAYAITYGLDPTIQVFEDYLKS